MRLRPVINTLKNYKATNYESHIHHIYDKRTTSHKLLNKEIKNFIGNPPNIYSRINGIPLIKMGFYCILTNNIFEILHG